MIGIGNPSAKNQLADRLRDVHVGVRSDLAVSRHLFRGRVSYVLQDPLSFTSHRLSLRDYLLLGRLRVEETLGETFQTLVKDGTLGRGDEERFYEFVVSLHQVGFLSLPVTDSNALYERFVRKRRARRRRLFSELLFLRIPVFNPDVFLARTLHLTRPFFSRWAVACWGLLVGSAAVLALEQRAELIEPLNDVFTAGNIFYMWATLIVLKLFHEFGHAYACKLFGGHVPEMGVFLVALTPCAYVDATASWGFSRKSRRLIVCMAGIYIEFAIAALAYFVWSTTEPSIVRSVAYNVFFLAGVTTLLFNINPLMRFDGYYALSDILEIPNLRQASQKHVLDTFKRRVFGFDVRPQYEGFRIRTFLLFFGVAASCYRVAIILGITAVIASKFLFSGLIFGVIYVTLELTRTTAKAVRWLWFSEETAAVRGRAVVVGVGLLVVLPSAVLLVPLPTGVNASAVVGVEKEALAFTETAGMLESISVRPGALVAEDEALATLRDPEVLEAVVEVVGKHRKAEILYRAARVEGRLLAKKQEKTLEVFERAVRTRRQEAERLTVRSPGDGTVLRCLSSGDLGRYLERGEIVAVVGAGRWVVHTLLTETQMAEVRPATGQEVEFRATGDAGFVSTGEILRITRTGPELLERPALTQLGGGEVAIDPRSGATLIPYFTVTVLLDEGITASLRHGLTGWVRLVSIEESLGLILFRKFLRFTNRLR